jgi:hypothetical protein
MSWRETLLNPGDSCDALRLLEELGDGRFESAMLLRELDAILMLSFAGSFTLSFSVFRLLSEL